MTSLIIVKNHARDSLSSFYSRSQVRRRFGIQFIITIQVLRICHIGCGRPELLQVFVFHPRNLLVYFILNVNTASGLRSWENHLIPLLDDIDKFGLVLMYATQNQLEVIFVEVDVIDACGRPTLLKGIIPGKTPDCLCQ
jgi:hypothetical protein